MVEISKKIIYSASVLLYTFALSVGSFAFGSPEEAKFYDVSQSSYLSPVNEDGKFDKLTLNFEGNTELPKNIKVAQFFFRLYDFQNNLVVSSTKDYDPKAKTFQFPDFEFDGRDGSGNLLPDGIYVYTVGVIDNKDIESVSQPYTVDIDNTPPEIDRAAVVAGNMIFSPSNVLELEVEGSAEKYWAFLAVDKDGKEHTIFEQKKDLETAPPYSWKWDGKDFQNENLPGGVYTLKIIAKDAAENTTEYTVTTKAIIGSTGALGIAKLDDPYFSPNGDGVQDTLELPLIVPEDLRDVNVNRVSGDFKVMRVDDGSSDTIPIGDISDNPSVTFTGKRADGTVLPDGEYKVSLVLRDDKNEIITNAVSVFIDTVEPMSTINIQTSPTPRNDEDPLFYGGEQHSAIVISLERLEAEPWTYTLLSADSKVLTTQDISFDENNKATIMIERDYMVDGEALEDGKYSISFSSVDRAGNRGSIGPVGFYRDTQEKELQVNVLGNKTASALQKPLIFNFSYDKVGLKEFNLGVVDSGGTSVRTRDLPYGLSSFEWYAKDNSGAPVADGAYSFFLEISYFNGTVLRSEVEGIIADSTPPTIGKFIPQGVVIDPKDPTGVNTEFKVAQEGSEEGVTWTMEIRNIFDSVLYSEESATNLNDFAWSGKNSNGKTVLDGDYFYTLTGSDEVGNKTAKSVSFVVDTGGYEKGAIITPDDNMPLIYFPAYSDDIFSLKEEGLLYDNLLYVRSVARMLKAYPQYDVTVVGNAAHLLSGKRAEEEQNEVLIPLSRKRASQIRKSLIILGVDKSRVNTRAVGGSNPIIKNPTADNIWRNRRVEFELTNRGK